jgi:hypothetical protein
LYPVGSERPFDFSFCLATAGAVAGVEQVACNFGPPDPTEAACCTCLGVCSPQTLSDCNDAQGGWFIGEECNVGGFTCPVGAPANDLCANKVNVASLGDPSLTAVSIPFNNFCLETDGYNPVVSDFGEDALGADGWWYWVATQDCELVYNMCSTGTAYDSMIAIYKGPTGTDNGTGNTCPCPTDLATSEASKFMDPNGEWSSDEGCTNFAIGGSGILRRDAKDKTCYVFRTGGWAPGDFQGRGSFEISCLAFSVPNPPRIEDPTDPGGGVNKVRSISVKAPLPSAVAADPLVAIRVKLTDLNNYPGDAAWIEAPKSWPLIEGQYRWLGPPGEADEDSIAPADENFVFSELQCTPHFRDWTAAALDALFDGNTVEAPVADVHKGKIAGNAYGAVIHVIGAEIVPSSLYDVQAVFFGADVLVPDNFSTALPLRTGHWGDVVSPFATLTSISGQPNFTDIGKVVDKFRGQPQPGTPVKARLMLRGNLLPVLTQVNFTDIGKVVDAFRAIPYKETGPANCPP